MYRETEYDKRAQEDFQYVGEKLEEYTRRRNAGVTTEAYTLLSNQMKEKTK